MRVNKRFTKYYLLQNVILGKSAKSLKGRHYGVMSHFKNQ